MNGVASAGRTTDSSPGLVSAVALGGALGALCRYWLGLGIAEALGDPETLVWGWMTANVLGSFLLGFAAHQRIMRERPWLRGFLAVGFLGAFTTFSAFAHDTWALVVDGDILHAILVATAGIAGPVVAATFGRAISAGDAGR